MAGNPAGNKQPKDTTWRATFRSEQVGGINFLDQLKGGKGLFDQLYCSVGHLDQLNKYFKKQRIP